MLTSYGLSAQPAQAGYVVDLTQGVNVVASGTGAIDLTGLTPSSTGDLAISGMAPFVAFIITGPFEAASIDVYTGVTGPARFGPGGGQDASSGTGDSVGVEIATHMLFVPSGYVSDTPLSDTATYTDASFASLGVSRGTFEWTWGTGANQNFTLVIEEAPEPSTWAMMLLGFAGLGLAGWRHRRTACNV
jgi:hypothetical protein